MNLHDFLDRLEGVVEQKDYFMACCPSHEDKRPSLKVSEKEGKILIHCWAGCHPSDVIGALNLTWKDLFITDRYTKKPMSEAKRIATAVVDSIRRQECTKH